MADELIKTDKNARQCLAGLDKDNDEIRNVKVDEDTGAILVTLVGESDEYYQRTHTYSYASGRLKYLAKNTDIDAAYADTDWIVWKYEDKDNSGSEGPRVATSGVATEAAINGLSWNI